MIIRNTVLSIFTCCILLCLTECKPSFDTLPQGTESIRVTDITTDTNNQTGNFKSYIHVRDLLLPDVYIHDIKWSPNNNDFAILTLWDVTLYDSNSFEIIWKIPSFNFHGTPSSLDYLADGNSLIVYASGNEPKMLDITSGSVLDNNLTTINNNDCSMITAANTILNWDNNTLFVDTTNYGQAKSNPQIVEWNLDLMECIIFAETNGDPRSLDLSFNGSYLVRGSGFGFSVFKGAAMQDGLIIAWDTKTREEACKIEHQSAYAHFKPESLLLAVPNPKKTEINYWNIPNCVIENKIEGVSAFYDFSFSPNGRYLAFWDDGIWIIDPVNGNVFQKLENPSLTRVEPINNLSGFILFSMDGKYFIYSYVEGGGEQSIVSIWKQLE